MICPNCGAQLRAWHGLGGGWYRGVTCDACEKEWWSESFSKTATEAMQRAMADLLANTSFPADAEDNATKELEHRGCPHDCDACDQTISSILRMMRKRDKADGAQG